MVTMSPGMPKLRLAPILWGLGGWALGLLPLSPSASMAVGARVIASFLWLTRHRGEQQDLAGLTEGARPDRGLQGMFSQL